MRRPTLLTRLTGPGLAGALALLAAPGWAPAAEQRQAVNEPRSLACEFANGQTHAYQDGRYTTKAPAPLNFLIVDINLEAQSARVATGPAGTMGELRIIRALNANHYLEVLNEGFLSLTTVYDGDAQGNHPAVLTRHMGVLGQPVSSHYTGVCRAG